MLELHIPSVDASNGNIPISWCINQEIIDALAAQNAKDPCIVISLVPQKYSEDDGERNKEYRRVVRLKDLMTYMELPVAGENKIFAVVVPNSFKAAKEKYLSKSSYDDGYYETLLSYNRTDYSNPEFQAFFKAKPLTLEVPNAIFAKEPPAWEKTWVNWWKEKNALNQCDYRRQRIFAYSIQPILFLVGYILQMVCSIGSLALGMRGFSFKPLLHPLTYNSYDKSEALFRGGSVFIAKEGSGFQKWKFVPFMPAIVMAVLGIIFGGHTTHMVFLLIIIIAISIALILGTIFLVLKRKEDAEERAIPWYQDDEEKELLLCTGQQKPMSVAELPSRHKTLRIRYQAFKAQICRPFSR